ncbi:hypothetical protein MTP99_001091 [Tenebrio molitor]|nr:hypothetical protein MTP99_001091 [Tenebrio molitor]
MIDNKAETKPASQNKNNSDNDEQPPPPIDSILHCPSNLDCKDLHPQCMTCNMTPSCKYGEVQNATCNVNSKVECGYRWTTALILSITLGGFGADRFYLGHWQEGIGKLFSFGGLGVWTIIDVILISLHYLGPADGSLYI